jgi:heme-degrading monooxygenase HmoA
MDQSSPLAVTPEPPYVAVIFSRTRVTVEAEDGYAAMADRMVELAAEQPGFLGVESAGDAFGITVSYWANEDDARAWRMVGEHLVAQELGRQRWYDEYRLRVAVVHRDDSWSR